MDAVYCQACSTEVRRADDHCPSCGRRLGFTIAESEPTAIEPPPAAGLELPTGSTFDGRYTIVERVGAGGMGVVYKAIDNSLKTDVALKLIQPALAALPRQAERFQREVLLTRRITHENICRVHDIGDAGGILYLTMEWIEGETLQQLIRQAGSINESRALQIAEQIAQALRAAHESRVIHRDLKPANVMVDPWGKVIVLDFGLAHEQGTDSMTGEGVIVGTPTYMSPEQRAGEALDERSDLYSLGLILREMLTGQRLDSSRVSPQEISAEVNPVIAPVLDRALAVDKADRYTSAAEVAADIAELRDNTAISTMVSAATPLRIQKPATAWQRPWLWLAGAGVVLAAVTLYAWIQGPPDDGRAAAADQYFQRGLQYLREEAETEQTTGKAIDFFNRADDAQPDNPAVLAALGEAYWLRFRRTRDALFRDEAQRRIRQARELDPDLPQVRIAQAVGLVAQGKYHGAKDELELALGKNRRIAWAWAYLGDVHRELGNYAEGRRAFDEALALAPKNVRIHLRLGVFYDHFQEFGEAAKSYRAAAQLKPDSAIAWNNLGASLLNNARLDEAREAFTRSVEADDNADAQSNLGTVLYFLGQYDEAVKHYQRATVLDSERPDHWGNLADALAAQGRAEEARHNYSMAAQRAKKRALEAPRDAHVQIKCAAFCAKAGDANSALEHGGIAVQIRGDDPFVLMLYSEVLCLVERPDESLDWLEKAVRLGASKPQIRAIPCFQGLVGHPRYGGIMATGG